MEAAAVVAPPLGPGLIIDPERITLAQWWELMGKNRRQGRLSRSRVFWQYVEFVHYHASEVDSCIEDTDYLANTYARKYGVKPKRFYDHRKLLVDVGVIRQVRHSAPRRAAVWQLVMPFSAMPGDVGPDLARALRLDLPEEAIAEPTAESEYSVGWLSDSPPQWETVKIRHLAWRPGEQPPDPVRLSVEAGLPWIDVETLCVARGLRAEHAYATAQERDFDPVEAEAAVRRRLRFSVAEPVDNTAAQTPSVTPDPEVSPSSLVSLFPTIDPTLRKYWSSPVDNAAAEVGEGRPSAGDWKDRVGPAERRRSAKVLRRAWGAWKGWQKACGRPVDLAPIRAGEWDDLVDAAALALRRMTDGELLDLVTESLDDSIQNLARTVSWRIWRQIKTRPEWAAQRQVDLGDGRFAEAIGPHSAEAARRLAELGAHTVRTGLGGAAGRYPTLPFPTADHAPEHVQAARDALLRSTVNDLTGRGRRTRTQYNPAPGHWEIEQSIATAQAQMDAAFAAAAPPAGEPGPAPSRPRTAAESAALQATALARARAEKAAAAAAERRAEREAWTIPAQTTGTPDSRTPEAAPASAPEASLWHARLADLAQQYPIRDLDKDRAGDDL